MLKDNGWSDGEIELQGRNSIIFAASWSGEVTSSLAHPMTVIDEKLIDAMGADEGLAIPIVSDTVAIVLVGKKAVPEPYMNAQRAILPVFRPVLVQ